MAEELVMTKETTPKKVAFASKPYSKEDKRKKEEDELKLMVNQSQTMLRNAVLKSVMVIYEGIRKSKQKILRRK